MGYLILIIFKKVKYLIEIRKYSMKIKMKPYFNNSEIFNFIIKENK